MALAVGVAAAWTAVRSDAPSVDAALVLVAVVAGIGFLGRRAAVLGAATGAAGGFTFFDTAPYERWAITHAADGVTAILLLVVGLAAGELAVRVGRQRRGRGVADDRLARIREAARRLAEGEELGPMIGSVAEQLEAMLALRSCQFSMEEADQDLPAFDRTGTLTGAGPDTGGHIPVATLPVLSLGTVVARFVMEAGPATTWDRAQVLVAVTLADQVGAALAAQAPPADPTTPPAEGQPGGPRLRVVR